MLGGMVRAAGRAVGQRARGRGRGRGRAGRGNQGGMSAMGRGRGVRGGPRPQRGRGRSRGRNLDAMRAGQQAASRGLTGPRSLGRNLDAIRAQQAASNRAGTVGPRLFNPSRPVNARLLGGIGPSRAVNPAARQRQLQAMGNLQRPRPINPNQGVAQFLGLSARPMNPRAARGSLLGRSASRRPFTTPMGNTYFGGNRGAGGFVSTPFSRFPRGPQMARRGRGRGLFG